jgi:tetratricopeptide (TPR) repeat protein
MKVGRNEACPCGSGRKYEQCHGAGFAGAVPTAKASAVAIAKAIHQAVSHHAAGRLAEAEAQYRWVLAQHPENSDAIHFLGYLAYQAGNLETALTMMQRSLVLNPGAPQYHGNLGMVLMAAERLDEAEQAYLRSIKLKPDGAESLNNLGSLYQIQGRFADALGCFERAIAIKPDYLDALINRAQSLASMGNLDAACAEFEAVLQRAPSNAEAHYFLGIARFQQGRLVEGWQEYEWRTNSALNKQYRVHVRPFPATRWDGQDLAGKTLLVHSEQGLGDDLWTSGMLGQLPVKSNDGSRLIVECMAKLVPLFRRSFPRAEVVAKTNPPDAACLSGVDFQSPGGSLGKYLRPALASFPSRRAYLVANEYRETYWKEKLSSLGPGLKVGVAWRSSNIKGDRALQCTKLTQWGEVLRVPGVQFINLQYDECEAELAATEAAFGVRIRRYPEVDMFDDLDETAALMRGLDLVIGAPTSVTILSAALGVPTWQMNYGAEWQCHGLPDNPWYPAMRNYARRWDQSWDRVFEKIAYDLAAMQRARDGPKARV